MAPFVRRDLEILRSRYEVRPLRYRRRRDLPALARAVATSDVVVCWFAWDHALWAGRLARALGKPSVLITGGFDVVGLPDIGYGSLLNKSSAARVRETFRSATRILAISESVRGAVSEISGRSDVDLIPLGFDPKEMPPPEQKEPLVITAGYTTPANLARKGIASFMKVARSMPEVRFAIIGAVSPELAERLRTETPSNLTFTGFVSDEELVQWMRRAKVYVQLSAHEGFGSAVAEAMLAGCIPVVSNRGALPEVVGGEGAQVPWGDIEAARRAVATALRSSPENSRRCRERIAMLFPLDRRREALLAVLGTLLGRTSDR
jgi:glycosyltransferase involved in cell wall biosynthesis